MPCRSGIKVVPKATNNAVMDKPTATGAGTMEKDTAPKATADTQRYSTSTVRRCVCPNDNRRWWICALSAENGERPWNNRPDKV